MASTSGSFRTYGYSDYGFPDRFVFEWSLVSQSVENNTSTIDWSLTIKGDDATGRFTNVDERYVIVDGERHDDSGITSMYDGHVAFSGRKVIQHNTNGSGSFSAEAGGAIFYYTPYNSTGSGSWTLPTIPRASKLQTMDSWFEVEEGITIKLTSNSSSFKHKIEVYVNSKLVATRTNIVSGSYFTFTSSELNNIYSIIPSGDGATFTFSLLTYTDSSYSTQVGDFSRQFPYGYLDIAKPTFNNYTFADINPTTLALTGNNPNMIINGHSKVRVTVSERNLAIANTRGTHITHYLFNGERANYSSGSTTITKDLENFDAISVIGYAVDNRGTSSIAVTYWLEKNVTYKDYENVTRNSYYTCTRSNNGVGSQVTLSFSGKWWNGNFGKVTNTITAEYKYKRTNSGTYTNGGKIALTISGNSYSFNGLVKGDMSDNGFDISESYDIIVTVGDELSSVNINYTLPAGEPAIAIYKNKVSLGAQYYEALGGTQVWGDMFLNGDNILNLIPNVSDLFKVIHLSGGTLIWGNSSGGTHYKYIRLPSYDGYVPIAATPAFENLDIAHASNITYNLDPINEELDVAITQGYGAAGNQCKVAFYVLYATSTIF